ncbi:hypothetical protein PC41400_12750 [Paenibacillus chitinolyticus]|uniref:Uncharacterized protein n=1 Tax=Paenibacillus chitinolyticus TaxID=79263 RepID=A0A410WVT3_9BACL|nr:hypothetical protein [Paenibacillus chitinolyticus]MCY9589172.1 hypothetical protein [Paenibacillus chitinolyticus]MCY9594245.1 hypothetical protein [Paenibacillus chitinolyticus]QAV18495.1 hypothetical protein PC41400_12750 [Paenibacillus chitinolyticus]
MSTLLFLCNLVWFLACVLLLFIQKRKERDEVTALIGEIKRLSSRQQSVTRIIFADHKDPAFQKIDSLLSTSADGPETIVVINAPSWLIAAREKKWTKHEVIDAKRISSASKSGIIVIRGGKYDIYDEAAAYLAYTSS